MAGGTFKGIGEMFAQVSRDIRFATEGLAEATAEVFDEETDQMKEDMVKYIETRATPKVKAGTWTAPRAGRVVSDDSSSMKGAVSKKRPGSGQTQLTIRVGWVNRQENYYKFQEEGFNHRFAGPVEGMNAMRDAFFEMRERIDARMGAMGLRGKSY